MKALLIIFGLVIVCIGHGQSLTETNSSSRDVDIRQKMTGTWFLDYLHVWQSTLTIASNGDYVAIRTSKTQTNRLEGTFVIKDGMMFDTLKKSSIASEPTPLVFTNVIIRVTDHELVYRAENRSQNIVFQKVER
jgi:hypothetical protein